MDLSEITQGLEARAFTCCRKSRSVTVYQKKATLLKTCDSCRQKDHAPKEKKAASATILSETVPADVFPWIAMCLHSLLCQHWTNRLIHSMDVPIISPQHLPHSLISMMTLVFRTRKAGLTSATSACVRLTIAVGLLLLLRQTRYF